jgi:hypothetical protein
LGLATGAIFDTGTPVAGIGSAVSLNELVSGLASDAPYHWRLRLLLGSPLIPWTPWLALPYNNRAETDLRTSPATTSVVAAAGAPSTLLRIQAAWPNPFARSTDIHYDLAVSGRVELAIYDVTGRKCAALVDGAQAAGRHRVSWDGRGTDGGRLPAGVYIARLAEGDHIASEKVVLLP